MKITITTPYIKTKIHCLAGTSLLRQIESHNSIGIGENTIDIILAWASRFNGTTLRGSQHWCIVGILVSRFTRCSIPETGIRMSSIIISQRQIIISSMLQHGQLKTWITRIEVSGIFCHKSKVHQKHWVIGIWYKRIQHLLPAFPRNQIFISYSWCP